MSYLNSPNDSNQKEAEDDASHKFYFVAWRWHFYAGLCVLPFLMILAFTGLMMLWISWIDGRDGENTPVAIGTEVAPLSAQRDAALLAVPDGIFKQYIAPRAADVAAIFRIDQGSDAIMVTVDPYTAEVLDTHDRRLGWYDTFDSIHSDLLLGVMGDRILEAAASISLLLVITGLYLWWPRGADRTQGWKQIIWPSFKGLKPSRRGLWRALHGVAGFWSSAFLILFLISGLAWAGIWGGKLVQAWSQFPAEKWKNVPLSDVTHASLNHQRAEVPWALEQTPIPQSGSNAGIEGLKGPTTIDQIESFARDIGFNERFQLNPPRGETGVWTISRDSMSTDSNNPMSDRTVHIDQYTGHILADVRYEDYPLAGKAMAVGIALHMGTLGLWSVLANTAVCLMVIFLCISALVLWWKRRPKHSLGLYAPPMPKELPLWKAAVFIGLAVSLAFPMAGLTILSAIALDAIVLRPLSALSKLRLNQ